MNNLLKTEWLKLRNYKAFWWMIAIVIVSYPAINYLFYHIYQEQLTEGRMGPILKMLSNPFTFPDVWQTVSFLSSFFIFIPVILVIMFITNEYTYKTYRQNIIDGWSRTQFMLAKMVDIFIITLLVTIVCVIATVIIGYINANPQSSNPWLNTKYIGLFFLQTFSQLSLGFLIAFLIRKAFLAVGLFFFYYIAEAIIVGIGRDRWNDVGQYLPLEISDRILPYPRFIVANEAAWKELQAQQSTHIIYTFLLLALTWGICFWVNKKRDL